MTLATFTRGNGRRDVLFLHGFLGSGRNLSSLSQRLVDLRPDLQVIVADLPGHGTSPSLMPPYTFHALADPVVDFVKASPRPCVIVGHSMGGRVALEAAASAPKQVDKVILLDIAPGPIGDRNEDLEAVAKALLAAPETAQNRAEMRDGLLAHGLSTALSDWLLMNLRSENGALTWRIDRRALKELGLATRGDDLWPTAERVAHKVVAAYGDRSRYVTKEDVARMESLGIRTHAFHSGHYLHVDAMEPLAQWLAEEI